MIGLFNKLQTHSERTVVGWILSSHLGGGTLCDDSKNGYVADLILDGASQIDILASIMPAMPKNQRSLHGDVTGNII